MSELHKQDIIYHLYSKYIQQILIQGAEPLLILPLGFWLSPLLPNIICFIMLDHKSPWPLIRFDPCR